MILYLDSSSLVKLYVEESGSPDVHRWVDDAEVLATSRVAFAEVMAALARRQREGSLDAAAFQAAEARLAVDWADIAVVEVDELAAGRLAVQHALRGFDAMHLAAALDMRKDAGSARLAFTSFDKRQVMAAEAKGLIVLESFG